MPNNRIAGTIYVKIDGSQVAAKGSFTYNIGNEKKEPVVGSDTVHGFKGMPQPSKIEGAITDTADVDMDAITQIDGATITLELANGKTWIMREAVFTGDGDHTTEESESAVTFMSKHKMEPAQ